MVREEDGTVYRDGRQYLTSNLSLLYRKHGEWFTDHDEWLAAVIDNEAAQRTGGFLLRVATDEDMKLYANEVEVIDAIQDWRDADEVAERTKLKSKIAASLWFSENVETKEQAADFFALHRLNPFQFAAWLRTAEKSHKNEDGTPWEASPKSLKAYFEFWKNRNASIKGKMKDKADQTSSYRELKARVEGKK